jgi:MFS family permease
MNHRSAVPAEIELASWRRAFGSVRRPRKGLWSHRDFLRLWGAQGISALGSQVTILALPLTAVFVLHASAFEVALLSTAATAPNLVGIPLGVWVDRVSRRAVMVGADLGRAAMLGSLPALYGLGLLRLPHLYAIAVVNGVLSVCFEIASQTYLPSVVARDELIEANAKFEATRVVAWAGGPSAGGALVSLVTAPVALLADAASYVASAGLITSVSRREVRDASSPDARTSMHDLRAGAAYVLRDPYLRPLLLALGVANLVLGLVWSILIVFAARDLELQASFIGMALSLGQLGGFIGAVVAGRLAVAFGVGRVVAAAFFLFGPATLLLASAPTSAALPFLGLGLAFENLARALYGVCATSVQQTRVPDRLRARVTGFNTTVGVGMFPLGTAIGGAFASVVGLRGAMMLGAVIAFLPFIPLAASPLRSLRDLSQVQCDNGTPHRS